MCGFLQDKNDKFDWTRRKGPTPSSGTGPSGDHTSGNGKIIILKKPLKRDPVVAVVTLFSVL